MHPIILLLAYFSLIIGYSYNKGWFSVGGLVLLASGFFLLLLAFRKKEVPIRSPEKKTLYNLGAFGLIISIAMANDLWNYDMNAFVSLAMCLTRFLLFLAFGLSLFYLISIPGTFTFLKKYKFVFLFIIALALRLLMLKIVTIPEVDIFYNLKYRSMEILNVKNPYRTDYLYPKNIPIIPSFYPYGPLLLPLVIPFNFLGDPRYLLIISDILTALILYKLLHKEKILRELIPLLFLFNPQALFFASLSAVDNVIIVLFALFFYWFKRKKYYLAFLSLTFIGGIKHAYIMTAIYSLRYRLNKRVISAFLMLSSILLGSYGIFALWDINGIKTNLLGTFTTLTNTWIVPASLSFQAFLTKQSIVSPWLNFKPSIIFGIIPFIIISLIVFFYQDKSLYKMCLAMAISLMAFIFFAPYALFQYYTVVSSLILIALSLSLRIGNNSDA